jgi:phosphoribosyl 1,2-cyclic phosphate phosphodiesterase
VPKRFASLDFTGQMILLGTGTSVGVPTLGCDCPVCAGGDPRNQRTRCAAILGLPQGNLLIDTPPDLRQQLLRESIGMVHAVLFTHEHADHIFGLDDLRLFPFALGHPVPLYCEPEVEMRIRHSFDYAFSTVTHTHPGAVPQLEPRSLTLDPVSVLGQPIQPLRLMHGPRFKVLGFRFGNVAYCTDTNFIPEESLQLLEGLDTLVLGALRQRPHPTHFHLEAALGIVERLRPRVTYLTHTSHELDYHQTNAELPEHVRMAYDGLRIPLV